MTQSPDTTSDRLKEIEKRWPDLAKLLKELKQAGMNGTVRIKRWPKTHETRGKRYASK